MNRTKQTPPNAGKGRPKGALNKATREIRDVARRLVEDETYVASLQVRLPEGKAPHMETLLFHYAYGKPKETVDIPQLADMAEALRRKAVDELHPGPGKTK